MTATRLQRIWFWGGCWALNAFGVALSLAATVRPELLPDSAHPPLLLFGLSCFSLGIATGEVIDLWAERPRPAPAPDVLDAGWRQ